jgi:hypothetical protein
VSAVQFRPWPPDFALGEAERRIGPVAMVTIDFAERSEAISKREIAWSSTIALRSAVQLTGGRDARSNAPRAQPDFVRYQENVTNPGTTL